MSKYGWNWQRAFAGLGNAMQDTGHQQQEADRQMALQQAQAQIQQSMMNQRQQFEADQNKLNNEAEFNRSAYGPAAQTMREALQTREDQLRAAQWEQLKPYLQGAQSSSVPTPPPSGGLDLTSIYGPSNYVQAAPSSATPTVGWTPDTQGVYASRLYSIGG